MSAVFAPIGWGWPRNYAIAGLTADDLPELPMLRFLETDARNTAVVEAVLSVPGLARAVRCCDLERKYGLPQATASNVLNRARAA